MMGDRLTGVPFIYIIPTLGEKVKCFFVIQNKSAAALISVHGTQERVTSKAFLGEADEAKERYTAN